jgi:hypothetical protein
MKAIEDFNARINAHAATPEAAGLSGMLRDDRASRDRVVLVAGAVIASWLLPYLVWRAFWWLR